MPKNNLVVLYLALICLSLMWNSLLFFKDDQNILAFAGGLFSLLYLLSAIGIYKSQKSFLWLGIICLAAYTLYAIGTLIWALISHSSSIFLVILTVIFTLLNLITIFQMRKRLHYNVNIYSLSNVSGKDEKW